MAGTSLDAMETVSTPAVLVASGNEEFRQLIQTALSYVNHAIDVAGGGAEALMKLDEREYQTLVLDRRLPDLDAEELVDMLSSDHPRLQVILLDSRVVRPLASDVAPEGLQDLLRVLQSDQGNSEAAMGSSLAGAGDESPGEVAREPLPGVIGHSEHLAEVCGLIRLVAGRRTTVLLTGESGTGKEVIARALHQESSRAQQPMIVVNCAAIPESLLESELFGYTRGAFTGAVQSRLGRIHAAHGGTLFLDEIGDLPLSMQAKLLRFLQEGEVQRLGSSDSFRVDVRVIAATNANLLEKIERGEFRRDLYYRLAVFPIELEPLRRRPRDIQPLSDYFLLQLSREAGLPVKRLSASVLMMMESYAWPGNVRELQHVLERGFIMAQSVSELVPRHFPALLRAVEAADELGNPNGPHRAY